VHLEEVQSQDKDEKSMLKAHNATAVKDSSADETLAEPRFLHKVGNEEDALLSFFHIFTAVFPKENASFAIPTGKKKKKNLHHSSHIRLIR